MTKKQINLWLLTILSSVFLAPSIHIFAQTCTPPPAGMVAWFPGDGNARDIRGNNHGTVTGGVTFPTGKVAQAFSFDGTGDIAYSTINAGNTYTVDFWLRPTRDGQFYEHLISNNGGISNNFGTLRYDANFNRIQYIWNFNSYVESGPDTVPPNVYTHIALTYDGSVSRLYVNGVLVQTGGVHAETFNNPINIGFTVLNPNSEERFVGQIDEVEIFNRALAQTEIQAIVAADSAGKCKPAPTAASVSVGGRVITATGRGIRNVRLTLVNQNGESLTVFSNPFGYYRFKDVGAGETYILSATAKSYVFDSPTQVLNIAEAAENINFIAFPRN